MLNYQRVGLPHYRWWTVIPGWWFDVQGDEESAQRFRRENRVAKKAMEFWTACRSCSSLKVPTLACNIMQYILTCLHYISLLSELVPRTGTFRCSFGRIDGFAVQLSCGGGLDTLKDANYILPLSTSRPISALSWQMLTVQFLLLECHEPTEQVYIVYDTS